MIEPGKYKTRDGRGVIVVYTTASRAGGFIVESPRVHESWEATTGLRYSTTSSEYDLVSEWDESRDGPFPEIPGLELLRIAPVCPPGHSPARIAVAMNSEGRYVVSGYKDASDAELIETVMENADICELPDTRVSFIEAFVPLPAKASVVEGRLCNE